MLSIFRSLFTLLSLLILGVAAYLLWTWYQGDLRRDAEGVLRLRREDWRLWSGLALTAWSFLGRYAMLLLLAGRDRDPSRRRRGNGRMIASATGASLYVEEHGPANGQPIILTHGWSMDSTIWHYAKRDLAKNFRVVVWDLPGLGRSKRSSAPVSLSGYAQDLKSVMNLTGGRPILAGHSIGGMIMQTLARDDPDFFNSRIASAVLMNTTYTNPLRTMILSRLLQALRKPVLVPMMYLEIWLQPLVWLFRWQSYLSGSSHVAARLGFGKYVTRSQLDHVALLMTRNPPAVVARGDLAMIRWDATTALPTIRVPVTVVGADGDLITKLEASKTISDAIIGARLEVISGANHMGPVEAASSYNRLIAGAA
jgi:pimeloyl-ACP methyl ester carboxylesterase